MNQQDQRKKDAHRNQQLIERELMFVSHKQEFDNSSEIIQDRFDKSKQSNQELLCACGGRCEGICRVQHLNRERFANPAIKSKAAKDYMGQQQWAERCPSAYEEVKHYRT